MTPLVLIADDNAADVDLLILAFEETGIRADFAVASDGLEAMRQLRTLLPALALVDIKMPRADGFEVLAAMRADPRLAGVPVIIMSSSSAPGDRQRSLDLGATRYWVKPARFADLTAQVATLATAGMGLAAGAPAARPIPAD